MEDSFKGVVDIVKMKALIWDDSKLGAKYHTEDIPEEMKEIAREYRETLLEEVAEYDERLMEDYLEGKDISNDDVEKAIRSATLNLEITPVLCGTAFKNKGVQSLLGCCH